MTTEMGELLIPIDGEDSIILARQRARALAQSLGFAPLDQSRIATGVSELARNSRSRYGTKVRGSPTSSRPSVSASRRGGASAWDCPALAG